jgi:predicted RNA-binding Zn-ribbon protein involved in translation (DUF1610 family)
LSLYYQGMRLLNDGDLLILLLFKRRITMGTIIVLFFIAIVAGVAWKIFKRGRNVVQNVSSTVREASTRMSNTIKCKSCGTELPTTIQIECQQCGFTKTRNIASACPNCGFKTGFTSCPQCGESLRYS